MDSTTKKVLTSRSSVLQGAPVRLGRELSGVIVGITRTKWLVASDGGETAEHARGVAQVLAARAGVQLEAVGVETSGLPALIGVGTGLERTALHGISWLRGVPGVEIARRAEERKADLVVLGRRERTSVEPHSLGRTADTVLRRRNGPCLLIPETVRDLRRMVLALDGTRRGLGILESTAAFAAVLGTETISLHVCTDEFAALSTDDCWRDPATLRVQAALAGFSGLRGGESLQVRTGAPVSQVLSFLQEHEADVVVLGVRRGGPPGEMGSGHVGRDLLRTVPVAILTVPI
jgi:nucleotide-binding universal stress UspA family protein